MTRSRWLAGAGANDIANTGDGSDTINLAGTAAGFTANTGNDGDTINFLGSANDVTIDAGDGTDTVVLAGPGSTTTLASLALKKSRSVWAVSQWMRQHLPQTTPSN